MPWLADAAVSAIQVWGQWSIDQRAMERLPPALPELTSLAKKNPHFIHILEGLAVQFRNANTKKKIASGRGRKTKLGERQKRRTKSYEVKRGIRYTQSFMYGKATDPGKRRQSWYIARNMQSTLISVKKGSMEGMKEQMSMQTM